MNTSEIENMLRQAPKPKAPAGLKETLRAQAAAAQRRDLESPAKAARPGGGWLSRWWPALAPAAVSLACAAVFTAQKAKLTELQHLAQTQGPTPRVVQTPTAAATARETSHAPAPDVAAREEQEIARLQAEVQRLTAEIAQLEAQRAENIRLRSQLAARSSGVFTTEETQALEAARQNAMRIQCVNNLKQLGLAVRIWGTDNGDVSPPRVLDMTNEMVTPKILVCPADTARQPAPNWSACSSANCSYEYLAPSSGFTEPNRVMFRCPIHGSICLMDGSVQSGPKIAKWVVLRDGKIYFEPAFEMESGAPNR